MVLQVPLVLMLSSHHYPLALTFPYCCTDKYEKAWSGISLAIELSERRQMGLLPKMSNTDLVIYVKKCWVAALQEVEEIIY